MACAGHVLGGSQRGSLVCSIGGSCRDQPDARISRLDSTAQKMFGAGVVFEAIVVLAVNIRSDGTWDVVRLTSPSVGGSGAACGQSPEVKPAKKPRGYRGQGLKRRYLSPSVIWCGCVSGLAWRRINLGPENSSDRTQTFHLQRMARDPTLGVCDRGLAAVSLQDDHCFGESPEDIRASP